MPPIVRALPTFQDVLAARNVIRRYLAPTPLYNYPALDPIVGTQLYGASR